MTPPLVSVVVPAYNQAGFIRQTIDSVLSQEGIDFELVVADHSSTDGTAAILEEYSGDPRVTLLTTEAGGGAERNFNRVSAAATGEYLKLLPGDDYLKPGVLARQAAILQRHPEAVMTACKRDLIDSSGRTFLAGYGLAGVDRPLSGRDAIRVSVLRGSNVFGEPGSVMLRRAVLEQDGYWNFDYPFLVDQATYIRALRHGGFQPDPEVGAVFRMNLGQWSVALADQQHVQVAGFHHWLHREHPDIISATDARRGNRRARLKALQRRISYVVLKRRMS